MAYDEYLCHIHTYIVIVTRLQRCVSEKHIQVLFNDLNLNITKVAIFIYLQMYDMQMYKKIFIYKNWTNKLCLCVHMYTCMYT